jgi:hypothetical protein
LSILAFEHFDLKLFSAKNFLNYFSYIKSNLSIYCMRIIENHG